MARQPSKKTGPKKQKRNVPSGIAYINSTFNNTIVTISDTNGDVISWASSGSSGFKGAKKGTPFAAQTAAESAGKRAMDQRHDDRLLLPRRTANGVTPVQRDRERRQRGKFPGKARPAHQFHGRGL